MHLKPRNTVKGNKLGARPLPSKLSLDLATRSRARGSPVRSMVIEGGALKCKQLEWAAATEVQHGMARSLRVLGADKGRAATSEDSTGSRNRLLVLRAT
jgi:hypothetical protein